MQLCRPLAHLVFALLLALALIPAARATDAPRNDRIVGYWVSSSGASVTVSYTNDPNSFTILVNDGSAEYTAFWTSDTEFYYSIHNELYYGTYYPSSDEVALRNERNDWRAAWSRR